MTENSSAGLVMLGAEVTVTVTREEHHQAALARYPVAPGTQRQVTVELGWCTIASGKYRGQPAIEVRLDGTRVGELTYLMSQRYAPLITGVATHGGRPACAALIQRGTRGLELLLRLPRDGASPVPVPTPTPTPQPGPTPTRPRRIFSSHRPAWIAAAVVGLIFIVALANNSNDDSPPAANTVSDTSTTTTAPTTTTTPPPTTTEPTTTTTVIAPPPPPNPPVPNPPAPQQPAPKTTTKRTTPPPAPPVTPPPAPQPPCDPNYTGCVPVASDVDCAGGTGNGPAYVQGPIRVIGTDIYDLDRDGDGIACE